MARRRGLQPARSFHRAPDAIQRWRARPRAHRGGRRAAAARRLTGPMSQPRMPPPDLNDQGLDLGLIWSGWPDSNRRPLAPKASALAKLRYSPVTSDGSRPGCRDRTLRTPPAGYSAPGRRIRLMSERRRLAASLRSRAARLGRVARRGAGGGAVASVKMAASLLAAAGRSSALDKKINARLSLVDKRVGLRAPADEAVWRRGTR
jgi:hypothetical protein